MADPYQAPEEKAEDAAAHAEAVKSITAEAYKLGSVGLFGGASMFASELVSRQMGPLFAIFAGLALLFFLAMNVSVAMSCRRQGAFPASSGVAMVTLAWASVAAGLIFMISSQVA